jgi:hypothetical protein
MKHLSTLDRVIAGSAAVAFITLFLPWYGVTVAQFSVSWSGGATGLAGAVLLTAAGVFLVVRRSSGSLLAGVKAGPYAPVAGVAALGLLFVIVRWTTLPRYHASALGFTYTVEPKYGLYVALLAGIVETAAAILALRASGERVPHFLDSE